MKNTSYNNHHEIARHRGGTSHEDNMIRIKITMHEAINTLFGPSTPQEELLKIMDLNMSCLTEEFKNDVMKILTIKDPRYIYKKWMYLPNKEDDVIYKKEMIHI